MKKINGIVLLLVSIGITTLGSVFKIMHQSGISDTLLWVGMISFVVAIGMIIYRISQPGKAQNP